MARDHVGQELGGAALERLSPEIIDEYVMIAGRLSARYPGVDVQGILALIVQNAEVVRSSPLRIAVCEDPDDDKFLACAAAANVEAIVSGDNKLRAVSGYAGIRVVTPAVRGRITAGFRSVHAPKL